jgi:hypothetical protein
MHLRGLCWGAAACWPAVARPADDLAAQVQQGLVTGPERAPGAMHGDESILNNVLGRRQVPGQQGC